MSDLLTRMGLPPRMEMNEAIEETVRALREHGPQHDHWSLAYSGGKDSTAMVTLILWLLAEERIPAPKRLTILYADTRQELPPLALAAKKLQAQFLAAGRELTADGLLPGGLDVHTVTAPLDHRMLVYMLGLGVPCPTNRMRYCTDKLKIAPMAAALDCLRAGAAVPPLVLTGVRLGESAARDQRIVASCSRDGTECGQGRYRAALAKDGIATLDPIIHFRVCLIWAWLSAMAPHAEYGAWATRMVADAYGGLEAEEANARTGCMGCPVVSEDRALERVIALPAWDHLAPLRRLRPLYWQLREPQYRLRKPGGETRKDGSPATNQNRLGPMTLETRLWALGQVLAIQAEVNEAAARLGREPIDLLNAEEEARIRELIAMGAMPEKWDGDEPTGDLLLPSYAASPISASGVTVQPFLLMPVARPAADDDNAPVVEVACG